MNYFGSGEISVGIAGEGHIYGLFTNSDPQKFAAHGEVCGGSAAGSADGFRDFVPACVGNGDGAAGSGAGGSGAGVGEGSGLFTSTNDVYYICGKTVSAVM